MALSPRRAPKGDLAVPKSREEYPVALTYYRPGDPCQKVLGRYRTVKDAEDAIARIEQVYPGEVHAGFYGIDMPEEWS